MSCTLTEGYRENCCPARAPPSWRPTSRQLSHQNTQAPGLVTASSGLTGAPDGRDRAPGAHGSVVHRFLARV